MKTAFNYVLVKLINLLSLTINGLTWLIKRVKGDTIKIWNHPTEHEIIHAFTVNGVDYFQFKEIDNLPVHRYFAAIRVYEELEMRLTHEMLQASLETVMNMINTGKMTDAIRVLHNLRDRSAMIVEPEVLYKLASVLYFKSTENPLNYDYSVANENIKLWKSYGLEVFFCKMHVNNLIPYLSSLGVDLGDYLKGINEKTLEDLKFILQQSSGKQTQTEAMRIIRSQMETLEKSKHLRA